jgi:signal recognition particle GTPase
MCKAALKSVALWLLLWLMRALSLVRLDMAASAFSVVVTTAPAARTQQPREFLVGGSSFVPTRHAYDSGTALRRKVSCTTAATATTRLSMMFDQLSSAISDVVKGLSPKQRITEQSIRPALRQVRRALLDADVNVDVADALIEGVKSRSLGRQVLEGVTADQQFVKAMYDELLDMMGGGGIASSPPSSSVPAATLAVGKPGDPAVILLAGKVHFDTCAGPWGE